MNLPTNVLRVRCARSFCLKSVIINLPPPKVAEETGYNVTGKIDKEWVIEMEIKEQQISLFVVPGVPEDFPFETKTRKEISVSGLK
jgi:hypothetical protein